MKQFVENYKKHDYIKLLFFAWSLALALLVDQMIRVPLGEKGLQVIDLVIVFQLLWVFLSAVYGFVYVVTEKVQYHDLMVGLMGAARFMYPIVLSAYLLSMCVSRKRVEIVLKGLYAVACIIILFGIFQSFFLEDFAIRFGPEYSWDFQGNRLVSIFLDPNLAASFYSAFAVFSMTLLYHGVLPKKLVDFGLASSVIATFMTLSRGGIIGFFIALIVFFVLHRKCVAKFLQPKIFMGLALIGFLMIVLVFRVFSLEFLLETDRFGFSNESAVNRFANFSALLYLFFQYPFFGVGFNYVRSLYEDFFYGFSGSYVDGGVLLLLASLGVFGFILLIFFLVVYLQNSVAC
ncbi:O-antigen ligase family protein [Prosthecochloris sp.]|uniref:O-antigen ligase family protein n=1 Tax=Prosthecochloris sp. TaxID=290513 RepID=UPI002580FAA0|nr:O-antigen ligase family protein [Prosthecochloris sp.]